MIRRFRIWLGCLVLPRDWPPRASRRSDLKVHITADTSNFDAALAQVRADLEKFAKRQKEVGL